MSNLMYTGKPTKEAITTSEQFYGSPSSDDNTSDGLGYMRGVDRSAVSEDDVKQSDEDFKEVNLANFNNVDMVMDAKSEEEQGVILEQQVFNKTESLHPEAPVSEDFTKRVQTDVQNEKLEYAEDELAVNPTWNEAGKILKGFLGAGRSDTTDSDFALQLGNEMFANIGGLNVSGEGDRVTGGLLPLVTKAVNSEDENVINALLYTMEMYDRKPMTSRGWVDGAGYLLGDASNYIGLGFVANATRHTVGKQVTNTAVKGMLREALTKIGEKAGKHPVATEAMKQGALWSAVDEMGKEIIKARSGVRGNNEIDLTNIAGAGVAGGIVGLGIVTIPPAIWRKGSKEVVNYINRSLRREGKGIKTFKRIAGEQSIIGDEAGSLSTPKEMTGSTATTVPFDEFLETANQKELSAYMRSATNEERPKLIEKMKSFNKKPKSVKAREQILVQEDFNKQFYSKLEHEVSKIAPERQFKTPDELNTFLVKQGVKPKEIEASGVLEMNSNNPDKTMNGAEVTSYLDNRPDKMIKRVYDEDSKTSAMEFDEWEGDVSVDHGATINDSDSGSGTWLRDENSGGEIAIKDRYNDEVYVDINDNMEYEYNEMQENWVENYASTDDINNGKQEAIDNDELWDDLTDSEQTDYVIAGASDESPWYEIYQTKLEYDVEGKIFDDYDDAEKYAKEYLFEDYEYRHEEEGSEIYEDYTVDGGDNYRLNTYQMEAFESPDKDLAREPHFSELEHGDENVQMHTRLKERTDADGNTGIVIEEVQSSWEQEWRRSGADIKPLTADERTAIEIEMKPFNVEWSKQGEAIDKLKRELNSNKEAMRIIRSGVIEGKPQLADINNSDLLNMEMEKIPEATKLRDEKVELSNTIQTKQTAQQEYYNRHIKPLDDKLNIKESRLATPPMQERTQYERVAMLDELLQASQEGQSFFGWNNSGIQNGSRVGVDDRGREGMKNAYDLEIPRIIQKATGQTPYKYYHNDSMNNTGKPKEYWDFEKAKDLGYDEEIEWYWRVDLDDSLTSKLNDSKIDLYSIGTGGLVGIGATAETGEKEQ